MSRHAFAVPDGYRLDWVDAHALATTPEVAASFAALVREHGSLHAWAASRPERQALQGRDVAWHVAHAASPTGIVVRRVLRGGLFRRVFADRWRWPTRASQELRTSVQLRSAGVATPLVLAAHVRRLPFGTARAEVVTAHLGPGADLPARWAASTPSARGALLTATAALLVSLANACAWHADLNLKNIYLTDAPLRAWVLDVDRVRFVRDPHSAMTRNLARFERSAVKWERTRGLDLDAAARAQLRAQVSVA